MAEHCVNTTFVVAERRLAEFIDWLKSVYLRSVEDTAGLTCGQVMQVLTRIEPDTISIAVQIESDSAELLNAWHNSTASLLADDVKSRFNGEVLQFSTFMERLL